MTTSDGIIEMTNFEPDTTPTVCPTEVVKNLNNKDFINVYCVWNNCEKIYMNQTFMYYSEGGIGIR